MSRRNAAFFFLLALLFLTPGETFSDGTKAADLVHEGQLIDLGSPAYVELFQELRQNHGFTEADLKQLFAGVSIKRRVLELMDKPAEALPYYIYRPKLINDEVIVQGRSKLDEHTTLLDQVEKQFGVEREVVIAIWGIETRYGRNEGSLNIFQTLNTLFSAYPRRSQFYRQQLIEFLVLCRENTINPLDVLGSYGGAFGQTQFIPSSFRTYAVDFDNNGKRDVWHDTADVLASIANYLSRSGWLFHRPVYWELGNELKDETLVAAFQKGRKGLISWKQVKQLQHVDLEEPPEGREVTVVGLEQENGTMRYVAGYPNFQAITAWNNSNRYAMAVTELSELLRGSR